MKTFVGKVSVAAAFICSTPLISVAQNISSQAGLVNRSIERVTLLPGPDLLSPARTTPTMMPAPIKLSDSPTFLFGVPVPGQSATISPATGDGTLRAPSTSPLPTRPTPEFLRFDSTLKPTSLQPRFQFRAGPKPEEPARK